MGTLRVTNRTVLMLAILLPVLGDAAETNAERAIRAVKDLCLAGSQFDLRADASGNLTLLKLTPGGEGSASVNVRQSSGAAAIFDDKIRQVADEDIRACIKPHIGRIVDAILGSEGAQSPLVQDLKRFAAESDSKLRKRAIDIRYTITSNPQCGSIRGRIDQITGPSGALERQVSRLPAEMSEDELKGVRERLSRNDQGRLRSLEMLISEGVSQGCIGL